MKMTLVDACSECDVQMGVGEKSVLVQLALHASNETGECYPAVETLARRTSCSERAVQLILRKLEARGLIKTTFRPNKSSIYQITIRGEVSSPGEAGFTPGGEAGFTPRPLEVKYLHPNLKPNNTTTPKTFPPNGGHVSVFDLGVAALGDQGISEKSARPLIGMWVRDWPEQTVEDAISAGLKKADLKSYVTKVLSEKPRRPERDDVPRSLDGKPKILQAGGKTYKTQV